MKILNNSYASRQRWQSKPIYDLSYRKWLLERGSLTARLMQRYADFSVTAVNLKSVKPETEEAGQLHISARAKVLVREVVLMGQQRPVVFAHSVLPYQSMRREWRGLGRLGSKPLGEVLFSNPLVKRTALSYKKLTAQHKLYQSAVAHVASKPPCLWARRSVFNLNGARIMVVEIFLPALIDKENAI